MSVFDKVKKITAEQLGIDEEEIALESSFIDDLNADSLDIVELIMAIEEEFEIQIPDEEVEGLKSVSDVVDYVKENQE